MEPIQCGYCCEMFDPKAEQPHMCAEYVEFWTFEAGVREREGTL